MPRELHILVPTDCAEDVIAAVEHLAPHAHVHRSDELQRDPSLLDKLEITYGTLSSQQYAKAKNLKWTQSLGAGCEWAQDPAVRDHPVIVTNSRIHAVQISEHLFGLLLMLTRRLQDAVKSQMRHAWERPDSSLLHSLPGKTLCILGLGTIGRRCATLGKAHGMRVIGLRRHAKPAPDVDIVLPAEELNEAIAQADVIMNLLPGVTSTAKIISRTQFALMKPSCLLLNAGRGITIDTEALIKALQSGRIAGAGLDVVDPEPLPPESPLWDMPNVIITGHYSGSIDTYFQQAGEIFLRNLRHYLAREPLEFVVDKKTGY